MSHPPKPNRSTALVAALAGGFLAGGLMLAAAPALADGDRRHHRHHHHGGKQVFYDGHCKVERKWNGHGGYKEEVKCRQPAHVHYYPAPVVAYYPPPPPPRPVYVGPPVISVVIPIGR